MLFMPGSMVGGQTSEHSVAVITIVVPLFLRYALRMLRIVLRRSYAA